MLKKKKSRAGGLTLVTLRINNNKELLIGTLLLMAKFSKSDADKDKE